MSMTPAACQLWRGTSSSRPVPRAMASMSTNDKPPFSVGAGSGSARMVAARTAER